MGKYNKELENLIFKLKIVGGLLGGFVLSIIFYIIILMI